MKKRSIQISTVVLLTLMIAIAFAAPAFALTEAEVEAQVSAVGEETVTGNVLIWFLCAVAFLKVSQKIDSFMASLGVNVGHTGGSMIAELMIATRGVSTIAGAAGHALGGTRGGKASGSSSGPSGSSGFLKGGLAGVVSRKVTSDAVKTATTATSAVHTATAASQQSSHSTQSAQHTDASSMQADHQTISAQMVTQNEQTQSAQTLSQETQAASVQSVSHQAQASASQTETSNAHTSATQATAQSTMSATHTGTHASTFKGIGLGGAIFAKSLRSGGSFANDVIGTVARGDIRSTGSITGELAAQSIHSYMGYTALGEGAKDVPMFSNVEIGGGRIIGIETAPGSTEGLAFSMYHADQYTAPQGDYTKVHSTDGALWYKQYAQDAVERKPYMAPDDTVAYHERIVKKLPDPPKRKDRI